MWQRITAAFLTFAAAFLARPIGVVLFGTIGDWVGRKRALVVSLLLMGVATVGVGLLPLLPTYGTAGLLAPSCWRGGPVRVVLPERGSRPLRGRSAPSSQPQAVGRGRAPESFRGPPAQSAKLSRNGSIAARHASGWS